MNAETGDLSCYLPERTPPVGVPLAIYACSTDDFTDWFAGEFDGRHWRAVVEDADSNWYVLGWRRVNAPLDDARVDCRALPTHPSGMEPMLLRPRADLAA